MSMELRVVDKCCVEEFRWRGRSARKFNGKAAESIVFWMGKRKIYKKDLQVGAIVLTKNLVDEVIGISMVTNKMIVIKDLFQKITFSVTLVHTSYCNLHDRHKGNFHYNIISIHRKTFLDFG